MPVLPEFSPAVPAGSLIPNALRVADQSQSLMERADQQRIRDAQEERAQAQYELLRPLNEASTRANLVKAGTAYDSALRTQDLRAQAYTLYNQASSDFDHLNMIPDDRVRATLSREWIARYSPLASIAELKPEMDAKMHLAIENNTTAMKLNMLAGAEARSFEALTQGMGADDKDKARRVKLGLDARPSSAAVQYKEVVGADGVSRLVAVDPRGVGAQVIGDGRMYGTGVDGGAAQREASPDSGGSPSQPNAFQSQTPFDAARDKAAGTKEAERQAELIKTKPKRQMALRQAEIVSNRLSSDIDDLIGKVTAATAGPGGVILDKFPGTAATDLQSNLDSIKANIGFQTLQAMREASPTGGALGQVSDVEGRQLQAALGSLAIGQSPSQLIENLRKVKQRVQENYGINRAAFDNEFGVQPMTTEHAQGWDETKERRLQELKAKLGK